MADPVYVTRPFLPPLEEFQPYLEDIWNSHQLTNSGPYQEQLELALAEHLRVKHLSLFAKGTLALITALQALGIHGEVITTPYSFVTTTHALQWNQITPIFVDIDSKTLNLDPTKLQAAITPETTAILATPVYRYPCNANANAIQKIADIYSLRVIYDAAHAFAVLAIAIRTLSADKNLALQYAPASARLYREHLSEEALLNRLTGAVLGDSEAGFQTLWEQ